MIAATTEYSLADLAEEAARRRDQPSFHVFAEGTLSDARGQIYNLAAGSSLSLPNDKWPNHLFIVLGVLGTVEAKVAGDSFDVKSLAQLVVLPGVPCTLYARASATVQVISVLTAAPR